MGTSINTGSDKQTYYKLSHVRQGRRRPGASWPRPTSPAAACTATWPWSRRAFRPARFIHLVNLGVPFPRDAYGQFVGYKTDHDPRQRATSIGPYTSREMCRALIRAGAAAGRSRCAKAATSVALLTVERGRPAARSRGAVAAGRRRPAGGRTPPRTWCSRWAARAGCTRPASIPPVHTGGIGLALLAGAAAQNLPESQYGLASIGFRWNVSGTYMQVVPRFISTAADGRATRGSSCATYFDSVGADELHGLPQGLPVAVRLPQGRRRLVARRHPGLHRDGAQGPARVPRFPQQPGRASASRTSAPRPATT